MTISMYQASVPYFIRMLRNLKAIMEKGAAHAAAKKFDTAVLVQARLAPDMLPFARQIQIASDNAKGCAARLAGVEPPKFEDTEATWEQLVERLDKTLAFLKSLRPEQVDGSEGRAITLPLRSGITLACSPSRSACCPSGSRVRGMTSNVTLPCGTASTTW